jgi:aryl-alcohol dehydrogenase-like predicted oxidoreductase
MEHVRLGDSGLLVSRSGYRGRRWCPQGAGRADLRRVVRHAADLGVTLFDVGDSDGPDQVEAGVGEVLAPVAHELVLAATVRVLGRGDPARQVAVGVDAILHRLGVEAIDLLLVKPVAPPTPRLRGRVEPAVAAGGEQQRAGKVRALGLASGDSELLRRAHAVHPLAAVRADLSLGRRGAQRALLPVTRRLGITVLASSPLNAGTLAGEPAPERLRRVARASAVSPAQVALAWLLAHGPDVVPIPATARHDHLEEDLAAVHLRLDRAQVRALEAPVQG